MLAAFVGFTAMVVSLCGPTLSQSSSALPANEVGCVVADDVQATPEMPPPPGPVVPPAAVPVNLIRALAGRSFGDRASAVVAPMLNRPMTIVGSRPRGI